MINHMLIVETPDKEGAQIMGYIDADNTFLGMAVIEHILKRINFDSIDKHNIKKLLKNN